MLHFPYLYPCFRPFTIKSVCHIEFIRKQGGAGGARLPNFAPLRGGGRSCNRNIHYNRKIPRWSNLAKFLPLVRAHIVSGQLT